MDSYYHVCNVSVLSVDVVWIIFEVSQNAFIPV